MVNPPVPIPPALPAFVVFVFNKGSAGGFWNTLLPPTEGRARELVELEAKRRAPAVAFAFLRGSGVVVLDLVAKNRYVPKDWSPV